MSEKNPFEDFKDRKIKLGIDINGAPLEIIPEVGDAEMFLLFKGTTEDDVKKMTKILKDMLQRSYPDADEKSISSFVAMNYSKLFEEVAILYGFVTRDKLDEVKKKAIEGQKEN